MDTLMTWLSLALLGYLLGAAQGWWRSPLDVMTSSVSRLTNRRSGAMSRQEASCAGDVMTDKLLDDEDDRLDEGDEIEEIGGGALVRSIPRRPWGPRPLGDLRTEAGLDDPDDEDDQGDDDGLPPRHAWVAAQIHAGRRPTEIDRDGARLYGVSTRQLARDRAALRRGRP